MSRSWLIPVLTLAAALPGVAVAQEAEGEGMTAEQFEAQLGYRSGQVHLEGGFATLNVPESFRFLDARGSTMLLEEGWGNPKGSAEGVLGMLVPAGISPLADEGWAVVITYDEDGYVSDKDAESIDYAALLKQMQDDAKEANKARAEQGYEPVNVIGWAEQPTYDQATHKMYWAKELQFGDKADHTLNYNIRVLGRRGVLVLNAVSGMGQLEEIKTAMPSVLTFVDFNEGHRYTDFLAGTDKVATYGLAGLVTGAVATKAGFFKILLAGLLAAKKALAVALVGLAASARKMWARLRGDGAGATAA